MKEGCVFYFFNESIEKPKKQIQKQKIHKIVKIDFFLAVIAFDKIANSAISDFPPEVGAQ